MKRSLFGVLVTTTLFTIAGCDAQKAITPSGTYKAPDAKVDNGKGGEKLVFPAPGTK